MAVQTRNDEMIELLRGEFQARYEPNFSARCVDSMGKYIPGIRGLWLASEISITAQWPSTSGALALTRNGNPLFSYEYLRPVIIFDGVGDYFNRATEAAFDIQGTDTYINANERGLMMGIWCKPGVIGSAQDIIGKWNAAGNQRSYLIRLLATNVFQAAVSSNGVLETTQSSTVTVSANTWYFVMMTYSPSGQQNRLAINVAGTIDDTAVGIPASLNNSTADFVAGASHGGVNLFTGRLSTAWLGAMYLEDYHTQYIREQMRAMYGR